MSRDVTTKAHEPVRTTQRPPRPKPGVLVELVQGSLSPRELHIRFGCNPA